MMSTTTIPIDTAVLWAKSWRNKYKNEAKAFLIPINDLIDSLEEMGIIRRNPDNNFTIHDIENAGVRAYMAIDTGENTVYKEKLLIVGTKKDEHGIHRDIVKDEKGTSYLNTVLDESGVFDFTLPCPSACDENSPLY